MKLAKKVNGYKIYELEKEECKNHFLVYPAFMAVPYWNNNFDEDFNAELSFYLFGNQSENSAPLFTSPYA